MSVIINTNLAATAASSNLAWSNAALQRSLTRLSSGSRIIVPSDDAGGLAVSMKISAAAQRMGAVGTNLANAVSFLQTQDGVLGTIGKILDRVSELKTLYEDATKNSSDKANYDTEFRSLQKALTAARLEKFNGIALFGSTALTVRTTEDGAATVVLEGVDLQTSSGVMLTVTGGTQTFTPTGPGTLSVSGTGGFDFTDTGNTYLLDGESAQYDGAGNWDLPAGRTDLTGATSINWSAMPGDQVSFSGAAALSDVEGAGGLGALQLQTVSTALSDVAMHRAGNGARQSRLNYAAELLTVNRANLEQANSRITDVDVAQESAVLAKFQVLVQAGVAMLSQANVSSRSALSLIG